MDATQTIVAAYLAGIGVVLGLMCIYGSIRNKGRKA